ALDPRFTIHDRLELASAVPRAEQVEDDAWIEVPGARPHHESAGRREAHRRVDGNTVFQRGHARAVAEMGENGFAGELRSERFDEVLVREPVKAVAPNSRVVKRSRKRKASRELGQIAVERGIETRDLRQIGMSREKGVDRADLGGQMKRRKGYGP